MCYIYVISKDICVSINEEDKEWFLKENSKNDDYIEFPTEKEMKDYVIAYRKEKRKEISPEDQALLNKLKERSRTE